VNGLKYVIIGNSAAAIGAIEGIRRMDSQGSITVISDETHHTYSRPLISYLLLGKTDRERMKYRPDDFYEKNGVTTLLGTRAVSIDPVSKAVDTDNAGSVAYDKLLVATGSSPFVPPMAGLDTVTNKFSFQCLDDALALEATLTPDSRVLIIGAGLIGLKCAEGILDKVAGISVVDLAPRVLSSILDDGASEIIKSRLEVAGLTFYLGDSVKEFKPDSAELVGGAIVPFDALVLAVGVRPNTSLLTVIGAAAGRAITIDKYCATSLPDIYAAGDCTESADASTGDTKVMALLPNAYLQGECAGINMTGTPFPFERAIPMNSIGFFGKQVLSGGSYTGEVFTFTDDTNYKKLFYGDNRLNGFILIGDKLPRDGDTPAYDRAGIYTRLVRERIPLDSVDFELISQRPGLMAFSRAAREEMLGGEQ
jgi:NAD(P)H-nitrite reductase large subunit